MRCHFPEHTVYNLSPLGLSLTTATVPCNLLHWAALRGDTVPRYQRKKETLPDSGPFHLVAHDLRSLLYFMPNMAALALAITSAFQLAGRRKRDGKGHARPCEALLPTSYW